MVVVDHYEVLDIPKFSSLDEIKKSYRKLALKYHPDKNKDDGAEDRFKQITDSYKILTDSLQRSSYDAQLRTSTRSTTMRTSTSLSTKTTTMRTSTTTTRATFNPKSTSTNGFQSPNNLQTKSYQSRNFDHLFDYANAKQTASTASPKSKFHYSNFERSQNVPPSASRPNPVFRTNPYTALTGAYYKASPSKESMKDDTVSKSSVAAEKREKSQQESKPKEEDKTASGFTSFHGMGKEEDPIVLDENDDDDDEQKQDEAEQEKIRKDEDEDSDEFHSLGSDPENSEETPAFKNGETHPIPGSSPSHANSRTEQTVNGDGSQKPAYQYSTNNVLTPNKRSASTIGATGSKKMKYTQPRGLSGRPNRTAQEDDEIVEVVDEDGDEEMSASDDQYNFSDASFLRSSDSRAHLSQNNNIPNLETMRNVPPFTQTYGDMNLDEVSNSLNGMGGYPRSAAANSDSYPTTNKRMKRDAPERERLPHQPVNSFNERFAHSQQRLTKQFINDHPVYKCQLPINFDPNKRIEKLQVEDLLKAQFDLQPPRPPSITTIIQTTTDFKQILNHFYTYEEQFKAYQTTYLSYTKQRAELDVLHLKDIFGYNEGTENTHTTSQNLMNIRNLGLFVDINRTDTNITNEYNDCVKLHNDLMQAFYKICEQYTRFG